MSATTEVSDRRPEWLEELSARLATSAHLVLVGAPNELHLLRGSQGKSWHTFTTAVTNALLETGYSLALSWGIDRGLQTLAEAKERLADQLLAGNGPAQASQRIGGDASSLANALRAVSAFTPTLSGVPGRAALLVSGAERLAESPAMSPLRDVMALAQQLALDAVPQASGGPRGTLYNTVIWLVGQEHDLPNWFLTTRGVHVMAIPLPDFDVRSRVAETIVPQFKGYPDLTGEEKAARVTELANLCEGMTQAQMREVGRFAADRQITAEHLEDAVRGIRSGLRESPWRSPSLGARVAAARDVLLGNKPPAPESSLRQVLGQQVAVHKALDVMTRSVMGLSDWDESQHSSRPRGVLFLAGPTGVGKTFLAKQLATTIFGREDAMVRFDMSEYSTEQSEARLIGSPPGYVGYESGGQLTNAVRQRPFSMLLFDEVDKAHPLVLDKFLQILEDGRLTDGAGSTVYFGETLIVFTSNLGIYQRGDGPKNREPLVHPGEPYAEVESKVRKEVERHFTEELQRPEIINRIGDNILVFDYLSPAHARELLVQKVDALTRSVRERREVAVRVEAAATAQLADLVVAPDVLKYGGRGVKNVVESRLVNPLARKLLDLPAGSSRSVLEIRADDIVLAER
ncbi:AAA family ATPase [Kribbella qitaiheensis]|uniref:AAA family ATPase n=1 Tax=Kribbella qitaiheensis TaxID=1544730 RepID=UPI003614EA58